MHASPRPIADDDAFVGRLPHLRSLPTLAALAGCPRPTDPDRLRALEESGLMDSEAEEAFDRLARIARIHLRTPVALVSLVGADRQFFKSALGLPPPYAQTRQTPLSHSFCRHVVESREPLAIADARIDPVHRSNPSIVDLGIVAYLGTPIRSHDGIVIGSFCVADGEPRAWTPEDAAVLRDLADAVESEIRLRAEVRMRTAAEATLAARQAQVDLALDAAGTIGIWEWDVANGIVTMDRGFAGVFGLDPEAAERGLPLEAFVSRIPPEDRGAAEERVGRAVSEAGPYALDHRVVRPDGRVAWIQARAHCTPGPDGRPLRYTGVVNDVTALHDAVERQEEVARELGHRVKNVMAMTQSLVTQTLRTAVDLSSASVAVIERIRALARAHDLLVTRRGESGDMLELARTVAETFGPDRFEVVGDPLTLSAKQTLAFSMGLHELATNAAKYGALSAPGGRVRLSWTGGDGEVALVWHEAGGPPVAPPVRQGLGTRLLQRVLAAEIEGSAETEYHPDGVVCRVAGRLD